ncbi:MAG: ATP synthase F1 subunit delta [Ruthenibacterium sp.]
MTAAEKEYGEALYSLAVDEHLEDELLNGLVLVRDELRENPAYAKLLANPAIKKQERLALLDKAFAGGIHPYALNFCKILCEKYALDCMDGCEKEYRTLLYAARGILPVSAQTAVALSDAQKQALTQKLSASTGKTVLLTNLVDASVLGGVKLSYAGKELDGTAAARLAAMRTVLTAEQTAQ